MSHTYGPTCHLSRKVSFSGTNSSSNDDMPSIKAQFFYSSPLPIDDPLSAIPAGADGKTTKHPPRPFSAYDNKFLEEAWLGLASKKERRNHNKGKPSKSRPNSPVKDAKRSDTPRVGRGYDAVKDAHAKAVDRVDDGSSRQLSSSGNSKEAREPKETTRRESNSATLGTKVLKPFKAASNMVADEGISKKMQNPFISASHKIENSPSSSSSRKDEPKDSKGKDRSNEDERTTRFFRPHSGSSCSHAEGEASLHDEEHSIEEHGNSDCSLAEDEATNDSNSSPLQQHHASACHLRKRHTSTDLKSSRPGSVREHSGSSCHLAKKEVASTASDDEGILGMAENATSKTKENLEKTFQSSNRASSPSKHHKPSSKNDKSVLDKVNETTSDLKKTHGISIAEHDHDNCELAKAESLGHVPGSPKEHRQAQCELAEAESSALSKKHSSREHDQVNCELPEAEIVPLTLKNDRLPEDPDDAHCELDKVNAKLVIFPRKPAGSVEEHGEIRCAHDKSKPAVFIPEKKENNSFQDHVRLDSQMDGSAAGDTGTSGKPFLKYTSSPELSPTRHSFEGNENTQASQDASKFCLEDDCDVLGDSHETETIHNKRCKAHKTTKENANVTVGISRLHHVELPTLLMKPIYWSPVHDIATVTRGTWFYKDTMYPVEPDVANQLEKGYRELRPWSRTWSDELLSALDVGAAGEEKISYRLWPQDDDSKGTLQDSVDSIISNGPHCAARCFQGEAAAEGTLDQENSDEQTDKVKTFVKMYPHSEVIYKDAQNAFVLKPSLQPSAYYGRKPLQKIKKGTSVGIQCVRGFDWKAWEKLYPTKKSKAASKAEEAACVGGDANTSTRNSCPACKAQEVRPKVTDLVLVIHGIGQKLSERVESFHFTHAINSFRRCVNVELGNESVKNVLRPDLGGLMVLPVNWRSNLSFEDGGPMKDGDQQKSPSDFTLKEITPKTIPAVRNLISDVMLDIPFYMSHHKPKMIKAVIQEANRVYRLWCKNNPEFHNQGRVHIIAHSLGSPMAVEVLSKQPTSVPKLDLNTKKVNTKHFDFNTINLFFVGSPAGFFLLLDKGNLTPRRGQGKPGVEANDDQDHNVTGESGTFGCLAVDNIYNIMHANDPIAYRLNATVDPQYASSLRNAQVPSATAGFLESIGNAMKSITPGVATPTSAPVGQVPKPLGVARLPSQLEMDVHDFTREEIAEKKFYLLNDNGQVDWFLSAGRGFEIQYLNMLGAHSSYWGSADFIRMIVLECGRQPGRNHTLPNLRAVKLGLKSGRGSRASGESG